MEIEQIIGKMLGLGEAWKVESCHYEEEASSFFVVIKETAKLWEKELCEKDQGRVSCYDHVGAQRWKHLNIFNKACEIVCDLPRGKCQVCGRVYRIKPPWEGQSKHFTQDFEAFALTLMKEMPMKKVEQITGVKDDRLWRMLLSWVDQAYAALGMEEVTVIGADELSLRKGHSYLTVFCDLIKKRVLFATPGKDAEVWRVFAQELERHNGHPHAIVQASIDMSPAYISGVEKNCRNAAIVIDKYHVMAQINKGVDAVRLMEQRRGDTATRRELNKTSWIWRKNPSNLTDKERDHMARIDHAMLLTSKAYQMRLAFQSIYQEDQKGRAKKRMISWIKWVRRTAKKAKWELLEPMEKVANMVESHLEGILAHWLDGITNAFLEGLCSVFSATKRKARGYRTNRYFIAMLYFVAGKLKIPSFSAVPFH